MIGWLHFGLVVIGCKKLAIAPSFKPAGTSWRLPRAKIALGEAQNMLDRLVKQTGPKLLKSLEANVKAIESDKLTQDASFNLEIIGSSGFGRTSKTAL